MRNTKGLDQESIERVKMIWGYIVDIGSGDSLEGGALENFSVQLDVSNAHKDNSRTTFSSQTNTIKIGADALPGSNKTCANSRMSVLACLCHELSHAHRYHMGFRRPYEGDTMHLDEAETSIHASYIPELHYNDRYDLIEDSILRLNDWKEEEAG